LRFLRKKCACERCVVEFPSGKIPDNYKHYRSRYHNRNEENGRKLVMALDRKLNAKQMELCLGMNRARFKTSADCQENTGWGREDRKRLHLRLLCHCIHCIISLVHYMVNSSSKQKNSNEYNPSQQLRNSKGACKQYAVLLRYNTQLSSSMEIHQTTSFDFHVSRLNQVNHLFFIFINGRLTNCHAASLNRNNAWYKVHYFMSAGTAEHRCTTNNR